MIDKIKELFEELINEGEEVLKRSNLNEEQYKNSSGILSNEKYSSFIYKGMDIILKSLDKDSPYYIELNKIVSDENKSINPYYYAYCFGIIKGAYETYLKILSMRSSSPEKARSYMIIKIEMLEEATKHLYYEINKVFEMYDYFETHTEDYTQIRIENFLLHARNLFDYFYPSKMIQKDDMCVYDFLDNYWEFDNKKSAKKDFNIDKWRINKYLSHLTYTRCSADTPDWQIIMEGMVKTIKVFYEALPGDYKNWNYIQKIKDLIKNFEEKHKINTLIKKEIIGTTSTDSGVSISGLRELS